ncbi:hypothetical protein B0T13DRAFT_400735, partial [Neurospora crassa]
IIINSSFVCKLRKLLNLAFYKNFNPGYVTLYKKVSSDFISITLKVYIKI